MIIEVYGRGCRRCYTTYYNVGLALWDLHERGITKLESSGKVTVKHIKDPKLVEDKMAEAKVQKTPVVFVDGVKMSEGIIPETMHIRKWIEEGLGLPSE